jgi:hypothetical protein
MKTLLVEVYGSDVVHSKGSILIGGSVWGTGGLTVNPWTDTHTCLFTISVVSLEATCSSSVIRFQPIFF